MLTFFRKIRKVLLESGRLSRYLIYAIGEILLVVIGILIALQINNWNEERKLKAEQIIILQNLHEVLLNDLNQIKLATSFHKSVKNSINKVLTSLDNQLAYEDSLSFYFWSSTSVYQMDLTLSVFETLKSKGVNLISNSALRRTIMDLYDREYINFKISQKEYSDYLNHAVTNLFSTRFLSTWSTNYDEIAYYNRWDHQFIIENLKGKMIPINYEKLFNDVEYLYFLRTLFNRYTWNIEVPNNRIQVNIESLIEKIENELSLLNH